MEDKSKDLIELVAIACLVFAIYPMIKDYISDPGTTVKTIFLTLFATFFMFIGFHVIPYLKKKLKQRTKIMGETILETDKIKIRSISGGTERGRMINMTTFQNEFDKDEVAEISEVIARWLKTP